MSRFLWGLLVLTLTTPLSASSDSSSSERSFAPPKSIEVWETGILIGDRWITLPERREVLEKILGPPDESLYDHRAFDYWGEFGLYARGHPYGDTHDAIVIVLGVTQDTVNIKKAYGGELRINGTPLSLTSDASDLVAAGFHYEEEHLWWLLDIGAHSVFTEADEDGTLILEFEIWERSSDDE